MDAKGHIKEIFTAEVATVAVIDRADRDAVLAGEESLPGDGVKLVGPGGDFQARVGVGVGSKNEVTTESGVGNDRVRDKGVSQSKTLAGPGVVVNLVANFSLVKLNDFASVLGSE